MCIRDRWDTALPWVLFAYREVPVETLGCSPFELMFGRTVSGPLQLVKSAWLQETDLSTAKQNVVDINQICRIGLCCVFLLFYVLCMCLCVLLFYRAYCVIVKFLIT